MSNQTEKIKQLVDLRAKARMKVVDRKLSTNSMHVASTQPVSV
jgi:hypothetical protein